MKVAMYTSTASDPEADWARNSSLFHISGHYFQATEFGKLHQSTLCNVNKEREREWKKGGFKHRHVTMWW